MRWVLWTHSRCRWTPVCASRDFVAMMGDADACTADGLKVVLLPEGAVPVEAL